ncbi:MAG: protein kinase domain-containing protein [bacterium]
MSEIHCYNINKLNAFFDGTLNDAELLAIEHHLDQCDYCFHYVEQHKSLSDKQLANVGRVIENEHINSHPTDSSEIFLNRLKALPPRELPKSIDHYHVIRLISSGGNGDVYECLDEKLNRHVALKTIKPHSLSHRSMERFQNEAVIQARLSHENIVRLFNYGLSDSDIPYLVMELLEGGTLSNLIQKELMSPRKSAFLIEKCARGLAFAHTQGVLHRDLKPSNILL